METFIPSGTNVTIFGQLPNRRWRCLVEFDELIKTMNSLVEDLEARDKRHTINLTDDEKLVVTKTIGGMEEHRNNLPQYPLIGSLPTSILEKIPTLAETELGDDNAADSAFVEAMTGNDLYLYVLRIICYFQKKSKPLAPLLSPLCYIYRNMGLLKLTVYSRAKWDRFSWTFLTKFYQKTSFVSYLFSGTRQFDLHYIYFTF